MIVKEIKNIDIKDGSLHYNMISENGGNNMISENGENNMIMKTTFKCVKRWNCGEACILNYRKVDYDYRYRYFHSDCKIWLEFKDRA